MHVVGSNRQIGLGYLLAVCIVCFTSHASAQRLVTFPLQHQPGEIQADLYGSGTRAVILAHGGRFGKESWKKQAQAFANAGFLVLAIRFRGDRLNPDGSPGSYGSNADNAADVLAAVSYLHRIGAMNVSAVGASLGGMPSERRTQSPLRATSPELSSSDLRVAVPRKSSTGANYLSSPETIEALPGFDCPRFPATIKKRPNRRNW
jgi:predicted alpha/beta-fold hydrolase